MPSVVKAIAEVPPRALREVDRQSRNPESAGERGRQHRFWHYMLSDPVPNLELCVSGKCEGLADECKYSAHKKEDERNPINLLYCLSKCY